MSANRKSIILNVKQIITPIRCPRLRQSGFALVITLTLLVLLTVIAVGLLTLSSVSLRSSSSALDVARARANARMALALALGDLQKQTGSDTRVTARADILDENNPPILGVWKSWEGTNHTPSGPANGRPISPGNDYKSVKQGRFLTWLTSGNPSTLNKPTAIPDAMPGQDKIALVGQGTIGNDPARTKLQVHLAPSMVTTGNTRGSCAWWIGGENQKARLPKPYEPTNKTVAGWSSIAKSHAIADPEEFRMKKLLNDATPADLAITRNQGDLIADSGTLAASREFFHDMSASSVGLLTNTATGGWRKDFSLLTEKWSAVPKSNQPFFRVAPGKDLLANIPTTSNHRPDKSLLYPWSGYRAAGIPIYEHGAVSSWENLKNWATLYKTMSSNGTRITSSSYRIDSNSPGENFNFLHKVRIIPVIARVQWVFSHSAAKAASPPAPENTYEPRLLATPVVTLWNPYNVTITSSPELKFELRGCLPNAFKFKVGETQNQMWNSLCKSNNNSPPLYATQLLKFKIASSYTFKPGETLLFSPGPAPAKPVEAFGEVTLTPGFRKQGGHYFTVIKDDGSKFAVAAATNVTVEAKFDSIYDDSAIAVSPGVGVYLDMLIKEPGTSDHYRTSLPDDLQARGRGSRLPCHRRPRVPPSPNRASIPSPSSPPFSVPAPPAAPTSPPKVSSRPARW